MAHNYVPESRQQVRLIALDINNDQNACGGLEEIVKLARADNDGGFSDDGRKNAGKLYNQRALGQMTLGLAFQIIQVRE